ncbi:MAG: hypothetical protein ACRD4L_03210, partial [Pyrinomonadaceae bacterium]
MSHFPTLKHAVLKAVVRLISANLCVILSLAMPGVFARPGTKTVRKPLAQTTKQETPPGQKKSSDPVSNPTAKGGSTTAPDITQNAEVSSAQNYPELGRIGVDTMK